MSLTEQELMKAIIPEDCHIDLSLYQSHKVGSGAEAYTFYTDPNFIVVLNKDVGDVKKYLSDKGIKGLDDIEVHGGVTLIDISWVDPDIYKKIKDLEYEKKK